ncbi:MAG: hypothetical protein AB1798_18865, partial [Spirochaetota bacterium]
MGTFNKNGLIIIFIIAALIISFGMNSIAQDKIKIKDKRYWVTTKREIVKLDDAEGHILMLTESKGADVNSGITAIGRSFYDLTKGIGTLIGYTTNHYPNGD